MGSTKIHDDNYIDVVRNGTGCMDVNKRAHMSHNDIVIPCNIPLKIPCLISLIDQAPLMHDQWSFP